MSGHESIRDIEKENEVPRFLLNELVQGERLGRGGFCDVHEITNIPISMNNSEDDHHNMIESSLHGVQTRAYIASHCRRDGDARYAIKKLRSDVKEDEDSSNAVRDLVIEAEFLAVLHHPNIIKMRAVAACDSFDAFTENDFLVLDRLYGTLDERIDEWIKSLKQGSFAGIMTKKKKAKNKSIWVERMTVAYDLALAFQYLHSLQIVYRDIKPENIGFDVRGDVKVFDFGLATEIHDAERATEDTYYLTEQTGSLRYMAPEVYRGEPYNLKADVYSFAVLLWQIFTLQDPYNKYNMETFEPRVINAGERNKIDKKWPLTWQQLLTKCWSPHLNERLHFTEISSILEEEYAEMQGGADDRALDRTENSLSNMMKNM